jgi:hypothetical protein
MMAAERVLLLPPRSQAMHALPGPGFPPAAPSRPVGLPPPTAAPAATGTGVGCLAAGRMTCALS